jgi:membrane-bound lytic murein transglycosylase D
MRVRCAARTLFALGLFVAQVANAPLALAQPAQKKDQKTAPKPAPKAPAKPAPAKPGGKKSAPTGKHARKPGEPGEPDEAARRVIAGTASRTVRESPELKAMRELDRALFPSPAPHSGTPWIADGTPLLDRNEPVVVASGLPPASQLVPASPEPARDLAWLRQLAMPDIPVRWDARVVRYLEFYKHNPRGRSMVAGWIKKSGKYGGAIRRILRENNLPEDILWLSLVESGFDPSIHSPAGAAGLWQFMPDGARIYGLAVDRWIDERLDPERSTLAAARYLSDLHTRFGSWELAFAAYNMGYGGLLSSIRKYNTNDFWELSRLESGMPLETALYVPKIVAIAIVAKNRAVFGIDDVELDPAVSFDKISVRSGVSLQSIALAAGTSTDKIAELNPQLVANRAPPHDNFLPALDKAAPGTQDGAWIVRVPAGTAPKAAKSLPKFAEAEAKVERYVVRWGETIDDIAARRHTTRGMLASLNGLRRDEVMRPGTVLIVPVPRDDDKNDPFADVPASKPGNARGLRPDKPGYAPEPPIVVVPAQAFTYADRKRLFYKVVPGDSLRDVAGLFGVTADEICRWNALDPGASLHDGMALQIYAPKGPVRSDVLALDEKEARVLPVGSPEFFSHFEGLRGRTRMEVIAKQGDTFRTIARRHGLSVAQLERINGRARSAPLNPGDKLVVYVSNAKAPHPEAPKPAKDTRPSADDKAPETLALAKNEVAQDEAEELQKPGAAVPDGPDAKPVGGVGKGEAAQNR